MVTPTIYVGKFRHQSQKLGHAGAPEYYGFRVTKSKRDTPSSMREDKKLSIWF
jgi:hypothetical protein